MTESSPNCGARFFLRLGNLVLPLEEGYSYTLGRNPSSDVRLGHGTVSDKHCRLEITKDQVRVHDLCSTNGTKIDGTPIQDQSWEPGKILEAGDIRVELVQREEGKPPPQAFSYGPLQRPEHALISQALLAHRHEETFGEIMATELRRAPWFGLSLIIHAAAFLLLLALFDRPELQENHKTTISLETDETEDLVEEVEEDEIVLVEEELEDEEFEDLEIQQLEEEIQAEIYDEYRDTVDPDDIGFLLAKVRSGDGDDILELGGKALQGGFRKTVGGLRRSGLELVFVFDSTGSMGSVLQATKDKMARMTDVLVALVPKAKIGVITYRDHGKSEAYLTRGVALSRDVYRAMNFMQIVYANGGADEPEAVDVGLREAFGQKWGAKAKRVVILVGDAPPHQRTQKKIASMVKIFTRNGRSHVHAIVTAPGMSKALSKQTSKAFGAIAKAGRGEVLEFEEGEGKILKSILSLAFGRDYSKSLDEIYKRVEKMNNRVSAAARDLARGEDREKLLKQFSRKLVPRDIVKAILRAPNKTTLTYLVEFLRQRKLANAGRQAASYILQKVLDLGEPPVDPQRGGQISAMKARQLLKQIQRDL